MKHPGLTSKRPLPALLLGAAACALWLTCAAASLLSACNGTQIGGPASDDGGGGGMNDGGANDSGSADLAGQAGYCAGSGPPIVVGDNGSGGARCSGQVAAAAFRYGLCLCQGLSASSPITIDAFDSTNPSPNTLGNGGSLGCNSNINLSSKLAVGGSLTVAGAVTLTQELVVGVDAQCADTLSGNTSVDIKRNADIGGDVKVNGSLKVGGTLTYPSTKTLSAGAQAVAKTARAPVSVAPPCDCAAERLFNVTAYVTPRAQDNDNAALGLAASKLTNFTGAQTLDLTCGRFYLDRIGGSGKVTINVSGRAALFVGGDVNLNDAFAVNLGPRGELDLFISGSFNSSAAIALGNTNAPARVRLYLGGNGNLNLAGNTVLGGNVYAPTSALVTSGPLEVFGAVFVRSFNPSASVTIHHDIAILKAGEGCAPMSGSGGTVGSGGGAPACQSCSDCGGQACTGGTCGTCTTSADCCRPLSCINKKCIYDIG